MLGLYELYHSNKTTFSINKNHKDQEIFNNRVYTTIVFRECSYYTYYNQIYFANKIKNSFSLAAKYFPLKIEYSNNERIITSLPKYEIDLAMVYSMSGNIRQYDDKILKIEQYLKKNSLYHGDLALRNICVDANDDLHLIDFESLEVKKWQECVEY